LACNRKLVANRRLTSLGDLRGGINGNIMHKPLPVREWSRWADQECK
jgi:hypothetical protein